MNSSYFEGVYNIGLQKSQYKEIPMRKMNRISVFLCALIMSSATLAAGWTSPLPTTEIYPAPGYNGVLVKQSSMTNPDGCAGSAYYLLKKDNIMFDELYALLMSSQARQSNIRFHLNGCAGVNAGDNTYPLIFQAIAF